MALPGVTRWSGANKRGLVDVINAKGSRRESDFVAQFDKHRPLRKALIKLGAHTPQSARCRAANRKAMKE